MLFFVKVHGLKELYQVLLVNIEDILEDLVRIFNQVI
jgi:hypothetical protein